MGEAHVISLSLRSSRSALQLPGAFRRRGSSASMGQGAALHLASLRGWARHFMQTSFALDAVSDGLLRSSA